MHECYAISLNHSIFHVYALPWVSHYSHSNPKLQGQALSSQQWKWSGRSWMFIPMGFNMPMGFVDHFKHHRQWRLLPQYPAFGAGAVGRFFHGLTVQMLPFQAAESIIWYRRDACFQVHANVFWCAAFLLLGLCYGNNINIVGNPFKTSNISLLLWRLLRWPVGQSCVAISEECDPAFLHTKPSWLRAWQGLFLIKQTVSFRSTTFHSNTEENFVLPCSTAVILQLCVHRLRNRLYF